MLFGNCNILDMDAIRLTGHERNISTLEIT